MFRNNLSTKAILKQNLNYFIRNTTKEFKKNNLIHNYKVLRRPAKYWALPPVQLRILNKGK